jgi:hypothetical protein
MTATTASFTNPATKTAYRLVVGSDGWRITKSRHDNGRLRLFHLRGRVGSAGPDAAAVAQLVAGKGGVLAEAASPTAMFAAVVLHDLAGTADVLTAIARESNEVYEAGCRGFRPRSPMLRRQRDTAMARAVSEMQIMAAGWRASGLEVEGPLPGWLIAAIEDRADSSG